MASMAWLSAGLPLIRAIVAVRPCRNSRLAANQLAIRRPAGLSPWPHSVPAVHGGPD
jgi:hypothetical protein